MSKFHLFPAIGSVVLALGLIVSFSKLVMADSPDALTSVQESKSCSAENPPAWPFLPLPMDERAARFDFFLKNHKPQLTFHREKKQEQCDALFNAWKANKRYAIIEPKFVRTYGRLFNETKCKQFDAIKLFADSKLFTGNKFSFQLNGDKEFFNLSEEDKWKRAAYAFTATENIELYDLNPYLGKRIWAYLGDAVVPNCSSEHQSYCHASQGYSKYRGNVVALLNEETCQVSYIPEAFQISRLSTNRGIGRTDKLESREGFYYTEFPDFSSVSIIDNVPYWVGLSSRIPLGAFAQHSMNPQFVIMFVQLDSQVQTEPPSCVFSIGK